MHQAKRCNMVGIHGILGFTTPGTCNIDVITHADTNIDSLQTANVAASFSNFLHSAQIFADLAL